MYSLCLALMLAGLPALALAQQDCAALGFGDILPSSGENLQRCSTPDQQCCSQDFIASVEATVAEQLRGFLLEEFEYAIESYQDDMENLLDFFGEEFLDSLVDSLPGAVFLNRSDESLNIVLQDLTQNYNIPEDEDDDDDDEEDDSDEDEEEYDYDEDKRKRQSQNAFDAQDFVEDLLDILGDSVAEFLSNGNGATRRCIREVADSVVSNRAIARVAQHIQDIRRSISTLIRIGTFLERQRRILARATFVDECVSSFVDLAFCSRCTEATPPLCFNTCDALLRACYSPYYTTLNDQYSRLWRVAQQVIDIANTTIGNLLADEATLIDIGAFVEEVRSQCGVRVPEDGFNEDAGTEKRAVKRSEEEDEDGSGEGEESDDSSGEGEESSDDDTTGDSNSSRGARGNGRAIQFGLVEDIFELSGAFSYGDGGLLLCLDALDSAQDCSAENTDQRYCEGTEICTATCYCTDGDGLQDTDTEPFLLNEVEDQVNNPVLAIDEDALLAQAASLARQNPVADFLSSDSFTSVAPEGVETGEDDVSAGISLVASLTLLLLSTLLLVAFA